MKSIYFYKGDDITFNMMLKVDKVSRILSEHLKISIDEAIKKLYSSRTYKVLQDTESTLWAENSEFIVDTLYREWEKV